MPAPSSSAETASPSATQAPAETEASSRAAVGRRIRFVAILAVYAAWLAALSYVAWVNVQSGNQ